MANHRWYRAGLAPSLVLLAIGGVAAALALTSCAERVVTRSDDVYTTPNDISTGDTSSADAAKDASARDTSSESQDSDLADDTNDAEDAEDAPQFCAPYTKKTRTGSLASAEINEASGLAASWAYDDFLWTHNDSGDSARVFLIRTDGALAAEVLLKGVENAIDFEDIAVAPCAVGSPKSCVYVADTGDNLRQRDVVVIYRFPEPPLPAEHLQPPENPQETITIEVNEIEALWLDYPEGPRDVETLMVHPQTTAIYLVEKNGTSNAPVFRVPREDSLPENPARAVEIASLFLEGRSNLVAMITAGDISPDGREFTVRTYLESYTYCAADTGSEQDLQDNFEDVFSLSPTRAALPFLPQAEALGYDRSGRALWITSEGTHESILRVERRE
ncbi:hypothetical protein [Bradymonas sediminis]|uniref:hypothetical protein n=1 Tax=Bradymonas sediminis TaxID=1548548 RepID=UPI001061A22B|nr:hypothetical protein [Bradymonas sediminis]TDP73770.1 hypothetical protein DFR33_105102 [Bradymonas sediminis]